MWGPEVCALRSGLASTHGVVLRHSNLEMSASHHGSPFGFNTIREKAVCPGSPNQTGRLGQTDPDPHTGVSYKGTVVSHPGTRVSPILLKRHIPDALAKVSEDVRDLSAAPLSPLKDWVG